MAIEITHVRLGSATKTEDEIVRYRWKNVGSSTIGESDKPTLVAWAESNPGAAVVGSGTNRVEVRVVDPAHGQKYLRTYADGKWTNNLVSLPTF